MANPSAVIAPAHDRERERSDEDKGRVSLSRDLVARLDVLEQLSRRQLELLEQATASLTQLSAKVEPPLAVPAHAALAEFHQRFAAYEKLCVEELIKGEEPKPFVFRQPKTRW